MPPACGIFRDSSYSAAHPTSLDALDRRKYTGDRTSRIRCILHVRVEAIRAERLPLWLNLVERFFAEITDKRIRRGTFCSVGELVRAIRDYIRRRNHRPRPFVWTASARSIARKVRRCNEVLETGD